MVNDPIGDFIIQLKNAGMAGHTSVLVPHSNLKQAVAETLKRHGFVKSCEKRGKKIKKHLEVTLAVRKDGSPRIADVHRVSKPGRRVYRKATETYPIQGGAGLLVLSTPKGILSNNEARKERVGGEALFEIW